MKAIVMQVIAVLLAMAVAFSATAAAPKGLSVALRPGAQNPVLPHMGDHLSFHSVIRNAGTTSAEGVIGWISLIRTDKGKEQPVDLEDWSAQKAVTSASLAPGRTIETDWPMRLIQDGNYRVVVSVTSRDNPRLAASPFAEFTVRRKPVVESRRVLPVALGVPLLLGVAMLTHRRRHRGHPERLSDPTHQGDEP